MFTFCLTQNKGLDSCNKFRSFAYSKRSFDPLPIIIQECAFLLRLFVEFGCSGPPHIGTMSWNIFPHLNLFMLVVASCHYQECSDAAQMLPLLWWAWRLRTSGKNWACNRKKSSFQEPTELQSCWTGRFRRKWPWGWSYWAAFWIDSKRQQHRCRIIQFKFKV